MSDVKLLPCPFCGGEAKMEVLGGPGSPYRTIQCQKCKCDMHYQPTEELATAKWNTRADHLQIVAAKDEEIRRLREALEKARKCLTELYPSEPCQAEHANEYYAVNVVINAADAALNPPQQKEGQ